MVTERLQLTSHRCCLDIRCSLGFVWRTIKSGISSVQPCVATDSWTEATTSGASCNRWDANGEGQVEKSSLYRLHEFGWGTRSRVRGENVDLGVRGLNPCQSKPRCNLHRKSGNDATETHDGETSQSCTCTVEQTVSPSGTKLGALIN
jgi:hypothetical protein